ncbi:MAG: acyltransferase [Alphaproteobacteria bacterium]
MKKIFVNLLCMFVPSKGLRHKIRNNFHKSENISFTLRPYYNKGKNNKIVVIKDGKRKTLSRFEKISNLKVVFNGNDNLVEIEFPFHSSCESYINIRDENNKVHIGKNFSGIFSVSILGVNSTFKIGKNFASSGKMTAILVDNSLYIGDDCMFSANILFHGDGHSVLDYETGKALNMPKCISRIGNHCWIGINTQFTKNAIIPDDCIVPLGAVVTKKFDTPHCIIAGNPAKIVKEGISWDNISPCKYEKQELHKKYKKYE